ACSMPANLRCLAATPTVTIHTLEHPGGAAAFVAGSVWILGDALPPTPPVVYRLDPSTNALLATVSIHGSPIGMVAGSGRIWVLCQDGTLQAIDATTSKVVSTFHLKAVPSGLAIAPDGSLWMTAEKPAV